MTDTNKSSHSEVAETNEAAVEQKQSVDGINELAQDAQDKLKTVEAEVADLKDRLLRAVAETENVRRRAERDRSEASQYAVTGFARDLLNVADNLRRALEAVTEEVKADSRFSTVIAGVEMTERELLGAFERHGIRKVMPEGEKFDHNLHQAMFEVETPDQTPGTIVQVMQPGYVLKDRLLRPAMVGVAKAPKDSSGDTPKKGVDETI